MRNFLIGIAALAGAAAFVMATGFLVPRAYEGSALIEVQAPPEAIWEVLLAAEAYPAWRSDVGEVERLGDSSWRETDARGGTTRHEAVAVREAEKFIDRFAAEGPPGDRGVDGGVRAARGERVILMVLDANGNTRVSITEKGEVDGPWDRFRARFADGYRAGPRKLGEDLRRRLGE